MTLRYGSAPIIFALGLVLTGCDEPAAPDRAGAGGEILEGSVSDDMLPYDTVRSQPPLAGLTGTATDEPGTGRGRAPLGKAAPKAAAGAAPVAPVAPGPATTPDATPPTP
jgi:hypothetical protein